MSFKVVTIPAKDSGQRLDEEYEEEELFDSGSERDAEDELSMYFTGTTLTDSVNKLLEQLLTVRHADSPFKPVPKQAHLKWLASTRASVDVK